MSERLCSVDGCDKPAGKKAGGLCEGHKKQKQRFGRIVSVFIKDYARDPVEGVRNAGLALADADTSIDADEAAEKLKEAARASLRRYLYVYVPRRLRRHSFSPAAMREVEAFIEEFQSWRTKDPTRRGRKS